MNRETVNYRIGKILPVSFIVTLVMMGVLLLCGPAGAADPEPPGWYAGDMHVHRSCGGSPEAVTSLYSKMDSQNLAVISLLADMGNGEVQNPVTDLPLVNGLDASISSPGRIVHWDAEWHWDATYTGYPHQALGGHLVCLGLTNAEQIWQEYTYPILDWARKQNGIAGFAHMEYLNNNIPQSLDCCTPIEYPVEVALGAADFISEDVSSSGDTAIQAYYRLLNCGFRPGFAAGTDYPCGISVIGSLLTYVQVAGGVMTYRNWIDGIKNGRTVVSRNGHNEFLNLSVNGSATPGDEVSLTSSGSVPVTVTWTANQNLTGTIEIVSNGTVVASRTASVTSSSPVTLTATIDVAKSGWIVARRMSSAGHQVHTGAVFVTVNGAPVRASVDDANFYVQWMDTLLTKTSPGGEWNYFFPTSLAAAQARYGAAKAVYQQIALEAAGQPSVLSITTTSLPNGTQNLAYSVTLGASGGSTPYTWSIASGLPTGLSLNSGTGVISGTPTATGTFAFTVQVTDSSSPKQTANKTLSITIAAPQSSYTIWSAATVPGTVDSGPDSAVELGVKFKSDVAGTVTGIRFYKASTNTGTHVGNLWSSTGTLLASAIFTNETASGWQQVDFSSPVPISANTVYVASYHTNTGHYSDDQNYFAGKGVDNAPLHALADGVTGYNGVYNYGSSSAFPSQGWNSSNYWVDVVFSPTGSSPSLKSIAVTPVNQTIREGATQQFTATGTYSDNTSQNLTNSVTWTSSNTTAATIGSSGLATAAIAGSTTISATLSGISGSTTLTVLPGVLSITTVSLANGTINAAYTATLTTSGGTMPCTWSITAGSLPTGLTTLNSSTGVISGTPTAAGTFGFTVQVADSGSPVQTATKILSITIAPLQSSQTIWSASTIPGTVDSGPDKAVELGVKFRSDVAGAITGIRFYKASTNTGTHVGNLWSSTGTRLATATFANETASGWQQVSFSTPVTITANTVYVASYHTNVGHYSEDQNYFASMGVDNAPLHALANGVSGFNGVYRYGSTSTFPNKGFKSSNYWVDVEFSPK